MAEIKKYIQMHNDFMNLMKVKGCEKIKFDVLDHLNAIKPFRTPVFTLNHFYSLFKKYNILDDVIELANKYSSVYDNALETFQKRVIVNSVNFENNIPINICGYNLFFHGTPSTNYRKILNDGYLKFTDYSEQQAVNDTDNIFSKLLLIDTGKIFVTDDFSVALQYALKESSEGYIMAFNLDGFTLNAMPDRGQRQFSSSTPIKTDRLVNTYQVQINNNKLLITDDKGVTI